MQSAVGRAKYNTLTPGEAKKLNKFLAHSRQPIRTASVLHKPRAPPLVVTNLDNDTNQHMSLPSDDISTDNHVNVGRANNQTLFNYHQNHDYYKQQHQYHQQENASSSSSSSRSASACHGAQPIRRHSMNYGRSSTINSRMSIYSTAATTPDSGDNATYLPDRIQVPPPPPPPTQRQEQMGSDLPNHYQLLHQSEQYGLSYRGSLSRNSINRSTSRASSRFQTISVDLGKPTARQLNIKAVQRETDYYASQVSEFHLARSKISDESYASAKSELSVMDSAPVTPNKARSGSKTSLSSSTYKVLQSPFANFKKLFSRGMPRVPFGQQQGGEVGKEQKKDCHRQLMNKCERSLGNLSIGDSASQNCLNRSQSPPVCPPPPAELKSMSYMEGSCNYSNYDDFTRSRNEQMKNSSSLQTADPETTKTQRTIYAPRESRYFSSMAKEALTASSDCEDSDSWQLTSLPVSYERNLATVMEERHYSSEQMPHIIGGGCVAKRNDQPDGDGIGNNCSLLMESGDFSGNLIKPPDRFADDELDKSSLQNGSIIQRRTTNGRVGGGGGGGSGSLQSLSSTTTADSVLDYHRRTAAAFRFSFTQPEGPTDHVQQQVHNGGQANSGLPPRMPSTTTATINATTPMTTSDTKQDTSSGNSSNCSSQLNGFDYCDRQVSLVAATAGSLDNNKSHFAPQHNQDTVGNPADLYGNLNGLMENDADTTIISETSTIRGDSSMVFANKCTELELTIASLKAALAERDKELTNSKCRELRVVFQVDCLKKQVNKLDKENAHLRAILSKNNITVRYGNGGSGATTDRAFM